MKKFYLAMALIFFAAICLDLVTKHLTTNVSMPLLDGLVSIYFTWNTGAGWSILSDHTLILTIFSALMVVGMIVLLVFFRPKNWIYTIGFALVFAGAVGNLFDRIVFGAVRDFICLEFINFPIFNVADICLTIGAILIGIWLVFFYKGEKVERK